MIKNLKISKYESEVECEDFGVRFSNDGECVSFISPGFRGECGVFKAFKDSVSGRILIVHAENEDIIRDWNEQDAGWIPLEVPQKPHKHQDQIDLLEGLDAEEVRRIEVKYSGSGQIGFNDVEDCISWLKGDGSKHDLISFDVFKCDIPEPPEEYEGIIEYLKDGSSEIEEITFEGTGKFGNKPPFRATFVNVDDCIEWLKEYSDNYDITKMEIKEKINVLEVFSPEEINWIKIIG